MSEEEIINEFKNIVNTIYLQGYIKDNNGKIFTLFKNFLELYKKEKENNERIKNYAYQEIAHYTENIKEYIEDDKIGNRHIIGELKENREHWKDIMKILDSEPDSKLYMNWIEMGFYE